jgi:hypothetical protein
LRLAVLRCLYPEVDLRQHQLSPDHLALQQHQRSFYWLHRPRHSFSTTPDFDGLIVGRDSLHKDPWDNFARSLTSQYPTDYFDLIPSSARKRTNPFEYPSTSPVETMARPSLSRAHSAVFLLAVTACLAPAVSALPQEAMPPQVTPPSVLQDAAVQPEVDLAMPISSYLGSTTFEPQQHDLFRRQSRDEDEEEDADEDEDTTSSRSTSTRTSSTQNNEDSTTAAGESSGTTQTQPSSTQTSTTSSASASPTAISPDLPQPFDSYRPSDFRSSGGDDSCPNFISNLLADSQFRACYPISMLLMGSSSFFRAQASLTSLVQVLDRSCAADVDPCNSYMTQAARDLTSEANCQEEYRAGHSLTMLAYYGLRAYNMLYSATCLQDEEDMYCYASAATNTTDPSDSKFYFMPYELGYPGGSTPSCSWCTQETMAIFHAASSDRSQIMSQMYPQAALSVNAVCGPDYVNATLPEAQSASSIVHAPGMAMSLLGIFATVAIYHFA